MGVGERGAKGRGRRELAGAVELRSLNVFAGEGGRDDRREKGEIH